MLKDQTALSRGNAPQRPPVQKKRRANCRNSIVSVFAKRRLLEAIPCDFHCLLLSKRLSTQMRQTSADLTRVPLSLPMDKFERNWHVLPAGLIKSSSRAMKKIERQVTLARLSSWKSFSGFITKRTSARSLRLSSAHWPRHRLMMRMTSISGCQLTKKYLLGTNNLQRHVWLPLWQPDAEAEECTKSQSQKLKFQSQKPKCLIGHSSKFYPERIFDSASAE